MASLTDRQVRLRDLFKRKQAIEEYVTESSDPTQALMSDEELKVEYLTILQELVDLL